MDPFLGVLRACEVIAMPAPPSIRTSADDATRIFIDDDAYILTFGDEFSKPLQFWQGYGSGGTWATSFSPHLEDKRYIRENRELQFYADPDMTTLPAAFTATGGSLAINATPLSAAAQVETGGLGFGSGLISTEMTFSLTHGYVEVRADVPDQVGFWSAFWLLPSEGGWSAEIDVFEFLGEDTGLMHTNVWKDGTPDSAGILVKGASEGFHTYGLLWEADSIAWYYDGMLVREEAMALSEEMYLILNLAVGGWAKDPDATTNFADPLRIDYVRAFELESSSSRNPAVTDGTSARERPVGTSASEIIDGTRWADFATAGAGNDTLYGDGGDDLLFGEVGDDQIFGHAGHDQLYGGAGRDKLIGGMGSDVLEGGAGADHLWGGSYKADNVADTFVFIKGCGTDYIHDFEPDLDTIAIFGHPLTYDKVVADMKDEEWALKLCLDGKQSSDAVYLVGVTMHQLSPHDFEFMPFS